MNQAKNAMPLDPGFAGTIHPVSEKETMPTNSAVLRQLRTVVFTWQE